MSRRKNRSDSNPYKRQKKIEPVDGSDQPEDGIVAGDESQASLEPGQMAQLIVDMRNGVVDQQAANAIQGPLNDLAKAFAMQAEILRGVHETQAELTKTLKKDKKAEMMVNATDSLNETFKGVRSTQQKLLSELDERGKRSRSNTVWMVGASLAVVVTIVGLFWWKDQMDADKDQERFEKLRAEVSDRYDPMFEKLSAGESTIEEWKDLAERTKADLRAVEEEKNLIKARNNDLERKIREESGLSKAEQQELDKLRRESAQNKPELDRLRGKVKDLEQNLANTLKALEVARNESNHLRNEVIAKLNRSAAESMAKTTEDENSKERIISREEAVAAKEANAKKKEAAVPAATVSADRVIEDLNDLLSNHRSSVIYRIESIGNVGKHHLEDVVFTESRMKRGVTKRIRAQKMDITISSRGDVVELNFKQGEVQQNRSGGKMGPWTKFYNDRYRESVYCLNGEKWMARNYGFFIVN